MRAASSRIDGAALVEVLGPLGAFFGLEPELVAELHDAALVDELVEDSGTSLRSLAPSSARSSTRRSARTGAVARTPVSPTPSCGSCEIRKTSARCSGLQLAVGGAVVESADELVDLLEQHAALQHAGRLGTEHEVAADDRAERLVGDAARGLVDDLQLGAQHPGLAGLVDGAQRSLPEAPAGRQQRVVGHEVGLVRAPWLRGGCRRGAGRSRRDTLSSVVSMSATLSGFLRSTTLRTTVSTSVSDSATVTENRSMSFCSVGFAVSAAWPVATTSTWLPNRAEQPSTMICTCSAPCVVVADVLLHLVEDDERQRQLARADLLCSRRTSSKVSSISSLLMSSTIGNCVCRASLTAAGVVTEAGAGVDQAWASTGET